MIFVRILKDIARIFGNIKFTILVLVFSLAISSPYRQFTDVLVD